MVRYTFYSAFPLPIDELCIDGLFHDAFEQLLFEVLHDVSIDYFLVPMETCDESVQERNIIFEVVDESQCILLFRALRALAEFKGYSYVKRTSA